MRFGDEQYTKVYVRDTATTLAMKWQTRAVWWEILRKVEKCGLLDCGPMREMTLSIILRVPEDVVRPAIKELIDLECVRWTGALDRTLEVPKFEEAQETKKTNAQSCREYRQRVRNEARYAQVHEITQTDRQLPTDARQLPTDARQPSSSSPSPSPQDLDHDHDLDPVSQSFLVTNGSIAPIEKKLAPRVPKNSKPVDPRLIPLRRKLVERFEQIRGEKYSDRGPVDTNAVKKLLALGDDDKIVSRFEAGLNSDDRWKRVDSIAQLPVAWPRLQQQGTNGKRPPSDVRKGQVRAEDQNYDAPGGFHEL